MTVEKTNPFQDQLDRLIARVEITREARFFAKKRLSRRHRLAYYMISLLSLFVILVSVIPNIYEDLVRAQLQLLLAITIVNSVFIIITTITDAAGCYELDAYLHQKCAHRLSTVLNHLYNMKSSNSVDEETLTELHDEYQEVLDDCPVDHGDRDYLAVQLAKPELFPSIFPRNDKGCFTAWAVMRLSRRYVQVLVARWKWLVPHTIMVILSIMLMYGFREIPYFGPGQ